MDNAHNKESRSKRNERNKNGQAIENPQSSLKRQSIGQAIEDYLKAIYELTRTEGRATTNQLANHLGIRPASVTGMLQRLATFEKPLVHYSKHRGVELTPEGERIAVEIIRHHRLIELFLHKTLGYSWDEVHLEADLLEHFISEKFEERIASILGNPELDPHGDPIPDSDLNFPETPHTTMHLSDARPPQILLIRRVNSVDPGFLRQIAALELTPGTTIEVVDYKHRAAGELGAEGIHYLRRISSVVGENHEIIPLNHNASKRIEVSIRNDLSADP